MEVRRIAYNSHFEDGPWVHFRAPDGNLYELTQGSDLEP